MAMTVGLLKNIIEFMDDDTEIRIAYQPAWPLEMAIEENEYDDSDPDVLYLSEATYHSEYLREGVADRLGW